MEQKKKDHVVALNRKARHDYFVVDTFECGVVLTGTEIKSVRAGKVNLKDGYAKFERGELWLMNVHISPYEKRAGTSTIRAKTASCCSTSRNCGGSAPRSKRKASRSFPFPCT